VARFCNHCENFENPVSPTAGISIPFPVNDELQIEVYLHRECAEAWSKDFNIPLPGADRRAGSG
jgi:hypothetical protein